MDSEHTDAPQTDGSDASGGRLRRRQRDPASTLTSSMVVYIFVNLLFGIPLAAAPRAFFDLVGFEDIVAAELGGFRWVGASLLAWGISGILVLARPEGRAIFVTAGALQLTLTALALLYSWSVDEYGWDTWFQAVATLVFLGGAAYLGFARLAGRKVLRAGAS